MADLNNKINDEALDEVSGGKLNTGLKYQRHHKLETCPLQRTVRLSGTAQPPQLQL